MSSLACTVALIVIGIAFLNYKQAVLNSSPYKLVFSVVFIECRLCRANHSYKIAVKVILIRCFGIRNKLIQSVVNILSFSAIFVFQDTVAYIVTSISVDSYLFALSNSFTCKAVQRIIGIFNRTVKFSYTKAFAGCSKSVNILYYNIIVNVNSFLLDKTI